MAASLRPYDEALLRRAFDVARRARESGDHPFGSVLADGEGRALMEQGNGYSAAGNDRTAHAESLLASRQRPTEVVGPLLEDEAAALQADFWKAR